MVTKQTGARQGRGAVARPLASPPEICKVFA